MNRSRLVCIAIVALSSAAAAQVSAPPSPHIVTSGEAQVMVTPDRASVFVGVQSRATTAALASADNARHQKAIIDTLKALGIAADQLATQNYSINPDMRYDPPGSTPRVVGYVVTSTVRVDLKRIDQIGAVIDAAIAKGANDVGGIQFSYSGAAEARKLAMADAVQSARADAEVLAKAAGGTLGPLVELSSSSPVYRPMQLSQVMSKGAAPMVATPIEPGQQTISASVAATWQFLPGR